MVWRRCHKVFSFAFAQSELLDRCRLSISESWSWRGRSRGRRSLGRVDSWPAWTKRIGSASECLASKTVSSWTRLSNFPPKKCLTFVVKLESLVGVEKWHLWRGCFVRDVDFVGAKLARKRLGLLSTNVRDASAVAYFHGVRASERKNTFAEYF